MAAAISISMSSVHYSAVAVARGEQAAAGASTNPSIAQHVATWVEAWSKNVSARDSRINTLFLDFFTHCSEAEKREGATRAFSSVLDGHHWQLLAPESWDARQVLSSLASWCDERTFLSALESVEKCKNPIDRMNALCSLVFGHPTKGGVDFVLKRLEPSKDPKAPNLLTCNITDLLSVQDVKTQTAHKLLELIHKSPRWEDGLFEKIVAIVDMVAVPEVAIYALEVLGAGYKKRAEQIYPPNWLLAHPDSVQINNILFLVKDLKVVAKAIDVLQTLFRYCEPYSGQAQFPRFLEALDLVVGECLLKSFDGRIFTMIEASALKEGPLYQYARLVYQHREGELSENFRVLKREAWMPTLKYFLARVHFLLRSNCSNI